MRSNRVLALDVFRGLTIFGMIIVNTPGSWEYIYPVLRHASWNGCTPTDLVFPFFIFAMGFASYLSIHSRMNSGVRKSKILVSGIRRTLIIFALGLFLNTFPFTEMLNFRIPGVLQRISIVNLACLLLLLFSNIKTIRILIPGILIVYWVLMTFIPVPGIGPSNLEPATNLAAWFDKLIFGSHVWPYTSPLDPEGFLSSFPAIVSGLIGILAAVEFSSNNDSNERLRKLLLHGTLLSFLGLVWSLNFPLNKQLWSSSFVLYTSGLAMLVLGVIFWFVDILGNKKVAKPLVAFGSNPIVAYFGSQVGTTLMGIIIINGPAGESSLSSWLFNTYVSLGLSPINASLLGALLYVGFWLVIVLILQHKKIFIKI